MPTHASSRMSESTISECEYVHVFVYVVHCILCCTSVYVLYAIVDDDRSGTESVENIG